MNAWIRDGGAFDGVADFDKATRDPATCDPATCDPTTCDPGHPDRMLPAYDSGDHLHPNGAGFDAMAKAIDLAWLRQ